MIEKPLAGSSKPENMHVFIPCNYCVHNDFMNSSHSQDTVLKAEEKVVINALKNPASTSRETSIISSTPSHSQQPSVNEERRWNKIAKEAKLHKRERLKKKKTNSPDSEDVKGAHTITEVMTIMPTLCRSVSQ